jgi:threonine dehydrogenase-like Zn-dependent dehydrogenase
MRRVAKPAGKFNVVLEEVPLPEPAPNEVRIRAVRSLISRGSEIGRRYVAEEAIDPDSMGYSMSGVIDTVGSEVGDYAPGDRVVASAPHAQYVVREANVQSPAVGHRVLGLAAEVDFDSAPFWPLVTSSVLWVEAEQISPGNTVVVVGQGLVGSLIMQVAKKRSDADRVVAIDALPLRCRLAQELGADEVIDAASSDPVAVVADLTGGRGADVVVYAVGGGAGPSAFAQAQQMVARGGLLHIVGLYEEDTLPLQSRLAQGRRILGGYLDVDRAAAGATAMELMARGDLGLQHMITHRYPYHEAAAAFDLLYTRLGETMAVLLDWTEA